MCHLIRVSCYYYKQLPSVVVLDPHTSVRLLILEVKMQMSGDGGLTLRVERDRLEMPKRQARLRPCGNSPRLLLFAQVSADIPGAVVRIVLGPCYPCEPAGVRREPHEAPMVTSGAEHAVRGHSAGVPDVNEVCSDYVLSAVATASVTKSPARSQCHYFQLRLHPSEPA